MRKSILFVAALALTFTACQKNEPEKALAVADFENINLAAESVYHMSESGTFESGDFRFQQEVSVSEWGTYYFGNIVSTKTGKTYDEYADSDKSAAGGAHAGQKFVVWTGSYVGQDSVFLKEAAVVPGFYICNTPWVVDAVKNGDGMSDDGGKPFGKDDWFTLTIGGSLNGKTVNKEVVFKLVDGTYCVEDWTYVGLSELGKVDALTFRLESTKKNAYGMTTPAYFAFDDLGAKK